MACSATRLPPPSRQFEHRPDTVENDHRVNTRTCIRIYRRIYGGNGTRESNVTTTPTIVPRRNWVIMQTTGSDWIIPRRVTERRAEKSCSCWQERRRGDGRALGRSGGILRVFVAKMGIQVPAPGVDGDLSWMCAPHFLLISLCWRSPSSVFQLDSVDFDTFVVGSRKRTACLCLFETDSMLTC